MSGSEEPGWRCSPMSERPGHPPGRCPGALSERSSQNRGSEEPLQGMASHGEKARWRPREGLPSGIRGDRGKTFEGPLSVVAPPRRSCRGGTWWRGVSMAPPRRSSRGPSVGDPRGEPSEEGTIRETPWSNTRTGAPRSPEGEMLRRGGVTAAPRGDLEGRLRGAGPGGLSMGARSGYLRGGAQGKTPGGRPPYQLLRGGAGPGAIRWGNPCRIPPRRGPVGSHPWSDAHGWSSEEPRRGIAPAGRGQGQGGRDLVGGGSEEPAPAGKLEGTHRGSLRGGRNGKVPGVEAPEDLRGGHPEQAPPCPDEGRKNAPSGD
jgi:hypothetical protein